MFNDPPVDVLYLPTYVLTRPSCWCAMLQARRAVWVFFYFYFWPRRRCNTRRAKEDGVRLERLEEGAACCPVDDVASN